MSLIYFAKFRQYRDALLDANKAMIALLAGSRLAAHSLQVHSGSPYLLPGLFPAVGDLDRFNLVPAAAMEVLRGADGHLSVVAIPYALSCYEGFVKDCVNILRTAGFAPDADSRALNAGRMHGTLYAAVNEQPPTPFIEVFHVLRCMRNAQIHCGGLVTTELCDTISKLSEDAVSRWEQLTMQPIQRYEVGDRLTFTLGHLIAAFATAKEGGREVNKLLGRQVPVETWADLLIRDYLDTTTRKIRNPRQVKRAIEGLARQSYSATGMDARHIREAAIRGGVDIDGR